MRDRAADRLSKLGEPAVPALAALLNSDASAETKCATVWALTRIETPAARAAVVAALDDGDASVRQAAARSAGLHRDHAALKRLESIVGSDEAPVRREAATALGRIGDAGAVPSLLAGLNGTESDRFLEHALIFALIRIGDRPGTLKGLALASTGSKRGALVALDQMDGGQLTPEVVTPFLCRPIRCCSRRPCGSSAITANGAGPWSTSSASGWRKPTWTTSAARN